MLRSRHIKCRGREREREILVLEFAFFLVHILSCCRRLVNYHARIYFIVTFHSAHAYNAKSDWSQFVTNLLSLPFPSTHDSFLSLSLHFFLSISYFSTPKRQIRHNYVVVQLRRVVKRELVSVRTLCAICSVHYFQEMDTAGHRSSGSTSSGYMETNPKTKTGITHEFLAKIHLCTASYNCVLCIVVVLHTTPFCFEYVL